MSDFPCPHERAVEMISGGATVAVPLGTGGHAVVDAEDWPLVRAHKWWCNDNGYVITQVKKRSLRMHRLVMGVTDRSVDVDHRNGDTLDNRRSNLRLASRSQNSANQRVLRQRKTSRFKGVSWHAGRWRATIGSGGRQRHLGRFVSEQDAARAYDAAAVVQWGEFAATNESLGRL